MLSVLIPIHNYTVKSLVEEVHKQLCESNIDFEIIVMEDGSNLEFIETNRAIASLSQTSYIVNKQNSGRTKTRQDLSNLAIFDWLLFLDADVFPKSDHFIKNYASYLTSNFQAIYGGFAYREQKPKPEYMLRWKYGKSQEEIDAKTRNKTPYKVIISANFLIKKSVFNTLNANLNTKGYGYDNYFGSLLKNHHYNVLHINNEVYHLGIERSIKYLKKKEQAAQTLLNLLYLNKIKEHDNSLLALFLFLKKIKLNHLMAYFYSTFQLKMKYNLLSKNPSIKLLQLYRISYMCYTDKNN